MKLLIITLSFFLFSALLQAQSTYIPDNNFEQALIDLGYDNDLDDYVLTSNISSLNALNISSKGISDLTGIQDFIGLKYLYCPDNQITSIDVTQNTGLIQLFCYQNQLTSIDVSNNTALDILYCHFNQLSELDVSKNVVMTNLSCANNNIQSLDLINNKSLERLNCSDNGITSLDLSWNNSLTEVNCRNNQLTSLNVNSGYNTFLTSFNATNNPQLTCIQVDNEADATAGVLPYNNWQKDITASYSEDCAHFGLTWVPDDSFEQALIDLGHDDVLDDYVVTANISGVTSLDVSSKSITDLTGIEDFLSLAVLYCQDNQLTNLNMSQNIALTSLDCSSNQLTSLDIRNRNNSAITSFNATDNPLLTCISVDNEADANAGLTPYGSWLKDATTTYSEDCTNSGTTFVPDNNFEMALINLGYDDLLDDYVVTANISGVTSLDVSAKGISDLTGIKDFSSLTHLNCIENSLTSLDVSQNTALTHLYCRDNQLSSLDLGPNAVLSYLSCENNQLASLDISQNTGLIHLICKYNELTSIDITNNLALIELNCHHNMLTSINLGASTTLAYLFCNNNLLTSIDVTQNTGLIQLMCNSNQLTSLDVSQNTSLDILHCHFNQINCIQVNNEINANAGLAPYNTWQKDETTIYSEDCLGYNSINGTITVDGPFNPSNFGVAAYDASIPFQEYSALEYGIVNADGTYRIDLSGVDPTIIDFKILFIASNHIYQFYDNIPYDQPENAVLVQRGANGIDAHLISNSIQGNITVDGEFINTNFGVSVYDANVPFDLSSLPLAEGLVNTDGSYIVDLAQVDATINEFLVLFISANHIFVFYDNVPLENTENAAVVSRGATNINAHLISNFISGTITVDEEFNANRFGVSVHQPGVPFDLGSPLASGNVNDDGTYIVDLSGVDKSITEFIVLFISEKYIYEFYNNVPFNQPELAQLVPGGSTGIDAHLQSNSIRGTITAEEGFSDPYFGVSVFEYGSQFDPVTSIGLAFGEVNPDGSYYVDLSGVDRSINEFVVLFLGGNHIWEYYNDVYYWEDVNLSTPVIRGATEINAHLNTNTIKGTITLDEGPIVPGELHVGVVEIGTPDPVRSLSLPYTTQVNSDGSYIMDLSQVDYQISEFNVVFIGLKYISELYNDVSWQTPGQAQMVRRGATDINAQLLYDKIPPELTVYDITQNNDWGQAGAEVTLTASATDNSGLDPQITYVPESRSFFPLGETIVEATATDGAGNQDVKSFTVTVLDVEPPEITAPDIIVENDLGEAGAIVILNVSATDNSGDVPILICTHTSGDFFPLGITEVICTATDGSGNEATKTFTVEVQDVEPPIIIAPDITVNNDPGEAGAIVMLSVTATDNSGQEPIMTCTHVSGQFFSLGSTLVNCTATDASGNVSSKSFTVTVLDNEPPRITVDNITVNNDPGFSGAYVTLSATSTDNSGLDPTIEFSPASGSFFPIGVSTIQCSSTDDSGNVATASFTVTVIDVELPSLEVNNIIVNNDIGLAGAFVSLTAISSDNSGAAPKLSFNPPSGSFFPLGTTIVDCTSSDAAGNSISDQFSVTVIDVEPPALSVDDIVVDADPAHDGAYVNMLAVSSDNSGSQPVINFSPASGSLFPIGTHTVQCTATDAALNTTVVLFTVTVNEVLPPSNEFPVITSLVAPLDPIAIETLFDVFATFKDDNIFEAVFDWGDGTSTTGLINGNSITSSHQYAAPGVYTLTLSITDTHGEQDTETYQYLVAYDPDGGFVTGGGWINSPEGAYVVDPSLVGKANFGFVAKYKKGSSVPTGNTEFQFKAGDLNFKSTLYDWLVVAGKKAKFKGEGTINQSGNYGFMLSAIDGGSKDNPDLFRIKIWEKASDLVVYNNQMGIADDADPSTVLGGGAITVHDGNRKARLADASVNIDQLDVNNKVLVYPNPVRSISTIELPEKFVAGRSEINIHLFNLAGIDVIDNHLRSILNNRIQINVNDLPAGVYILMIPNGETHIRKKITKL